MTEPDSSTDTSKGAGNATLVMIKAVHTVAWLSIESCVVYLLYAGLRGRSDRRAAIAGWVVAGETLTFAANGFRCPLTQFAERAGAESGSVTDIYLPRWFAHNLPSLHVPVLITAAALHWRNLRDAPQKSAQHPEVLVRPAVAVLPVLRAVPSVEDREHLT